MTKVAEFGTFPGASAVEHWSEPSFGRSSGDPKQVPKYSEIMWGYRNKQSVSQLYDPVIMVTMRGDTAENESIHLSTSHASLQARQASERASKQAK